ncbi:MAG: BtpA/SgcQ family protein [Chloroflexi bacterium]|nr:BtpA/SgcQ family protein [Chloroflexota bacterium]
MRGTLFQRGRRTLVGMVHLPPLPGSPVWDGTPLKEIAGRAVEDARALQQAGFDAVLLQNTGDGPPGKDGSVATVAQMTAVGCRIREASDLPLGINVLKNGVESVFAIGAAVGAEFVRIKVYVGAVLGSEGLVEGAAQAALKVRRELGLDDVAILADVIERTSYQLVAVPVEELGDWAARHGHADGLIVTGHNFDETLELLRRLRAAQPLSPLLVGGGATAENVGSLFTYADGIIVGSSLKETGSSTVSDRLAAEFVASVRDDVVDRSVPLAQS